MLVLSRKSGEEILITGESNALDWEIWVKVWKDDYGNIKVGINAPEQFKILRQELVEREGK